MSQESKVKGLKTMVVGQDLLIFDSCPLPLGNFLFHLNHESKFAVGVRYQVFVEWP